MLLEDYLGVVILLAMGLGTGLGAVAVAHWLGSRRYYPNKSSTYECGIPSPGAEDARFSVKFYLVAVSFLLFDIETIFLVPWALGFLDYVGQGEGAFVFSVGAVFLGILGLGLIYEWQRGLLDWNQ